MSQGLLDSENTSVTTLGTSTTPMIVLRIHLPGALLTVKNFLQAPGDREVHILESLTFTGLRTLECLSFTLSLKK